MALLCHVLTTFGFPLPAPSGGVGKDKSRPFPCQNHPCGCLTYEACWQGDCCCSTLEQKLRWAEENGIEPPDHVRPLVESRKAQPTPPPKKKKSCCSDAEPAPEPSHVRACCEKRAPAASLCCSEKPAPKAREPKAPPEDPSGVRWVAGIYAQKCRGEGPTGLFLLDPGIAPDLTPIVFPAPERIAFSAPRSDRAAPTSLRPPTPPPRHV